MKKISEKFYLGVVALMVGILFLFESCNGKENISAMMPNENEYENEYENENENKNENKYGYITTSDSKIIDNYNLLKEKVTSL